MEIEEAVGYLLRITGREKVLNAEHLVASIGHVPRYKGRYEPSIRLQEEPNDLQRNLTEWPLQLAHHPERRGHDRT